MQVVANFPGNQKTLGDDLKFGIYVVKKKNAGCVSIGKNFNPKHRMRRAPISINGV